MVLRTFLLVSDDPDIQLEFGEALYEISSDTILINIANAQKAIELLKRRVDFPNFIIFDLNINGIDPGVFLNALRNDRILQNIPLIAYGDYSDFQTVESSGIFAFLNRDFTYSDLKNFLRKIVSNGVKV